MSVCFKSFDLPHDFPKNAALRSKSRGLGQTDNILKRV